MAGSKNAYMADKVRTHVLASASVAWASSTLFVGDSNKYVVANSTEGLKGGMPVVPNLDPNKQYYITRIDCTFGAAISGSAVVTVRTDYATKFSMADSTLAATVTNPASTGSAVGLIRIDATTSITIKVVGSSAATTTGYFVLTIEER